MAPTKIILIYFSYSRYDFLNYCKIHLNMYSQLLLEDRPEFLKVNSQETPNHLNNISKIKSTLNKCVTYQ